MSLKVFYGDRIEDLAEHLKGQLLEGRAKCDPFTFSQIAVPNTNIAKWLQIRVFSNEPKLIMGIKFPFMEDLLTKVLSANLGNGETFSLLPDNAYATAIMGVLLSEEDDQPEFDKLAPFRAYISGGDGSGKLNVETQRQARMGWQLSAMLANLMDQYEVRRPEIVRNWLKELPADGARGDTEIEAAEAALARALWGEKGLFPANGARLSLRQLFDRVKDAEPVGEPQTFYFFGHSTLSILQVKILAWLARKHEVIFYHNNVCLEYWGDIENKTERIRRLGRSHKLEQDVSVENPLLQQWGVAGRETMRLLVELEEEYDGRIEFCWECVANPDRPTPKTILETVQESICHRTGDVDKMPQDASIQIVGAPGIRREVEMVYNAILGAVWMPKDENGKKLGERPWRDCNFSDIAVLVPDMATYRPIIEAVFDARDDIPYGLIDTTASEDSAFLAGFLALADLARKGLTRETLFAVLENPCIQKALDFNDNDVAAWRNLTDKIGAFDGFERQPDDESSFNWDWALSRLRLAYVADKLPISKDVDEELPLAGDGGDGALKFSEVVELLFKKVDAALKDGGERRLLPCAADAAAATDTAGGSREKATWASVLLRLTGDLLAVPPESVLESDVRRQIAQTLKGLSSIPGEQGYEIALAAVEQSVGGIACRKGGYLTDGVTIAGLQPMRPVPFRQIFVLGLGANGFPGRTSSSTLDIRGSRWRLGDTSAPNVNRYLFLETVMSARDRLVLSYPNRDIEKDAELFPSGIVRELKTFVEQNILPKDHEAKDGEFREVKVPLLERGEPDMMKKDQFESTPVQDIVWVPDDPMAGILPTYYANARRMARERIGANMNGGASSVASETESGREANSEQVRKQGLSRTDISAKSLAEFLKSPLRAALRDRLGIAVEGYRDKELSIDSPLGLSSGPATWDLQAECLTGADNIDMLFRERELAGALPAGFLGKFAKATFEKEMKSFEDELKQIRDEFGIRDNVDLTSRQRIPTTIRVDGSERKVQYVAETPNWVECGDIVKVLVTSWISRQGENPPSRPVDRTLAPFIAFLMHLAKKTDGKGGDEMRKEKLRVRVVDFGNAKTAVWQWEVAPKEAQDYLERLTARYLTYLCGKDGEAAYVDFQYKKLAKAIPDHAFEDAGEAEAPSVDWNAVLGATTREEWSAGGKKENNFNNNLVVEESAAIYRRDPTAEELEDLFKVYYSLPLSGELEVEEEMGGGAE